jgi:prepilin-type N-terminal cleavage/methylation domain-containing protein
MRQTRCRSGYTLLEVVLALAIATMLLSALYVALNVQLRSAQSGRDTVEHATLTRVLFHRFDADIASSINLADPARFRIAAATAAAAANAQSSSSGTSAASSSGTNSSTTSGTNSGTTSGATTTTVSNSALASTNFLSATMSTPGSTTSTSTINGTNSALTTSTDAVVVPMGVVGDNSTLTLYMSRVPKEVWPTQNSDNVQLVSDLRRVTYWMASGGGLARQEVKVVTSADAAPGQTPVGGDEKQHVISPEVHTLQFTYFDGSNWKDSWDATTVGADGLTPIGPPRAIAIELDVAKPVAGKKEPVLVHYRHVIPIVPGNGVTPQGDGTTTP